MTLRFLGLALTGLLAISFSRAAAQWTPVCSSGDGFVVSFADYKDTLFTSGFFKNICGTPAAFVAGYSGGSRQRAGSGLPDAGHTLRIINGDLYSVGYQRQDDSNQIYRWNGRDFEGAGPTVRLSIPVPGTSRTVNLYDIIQYNGQLVVCGEFDTVDGKAISGIAQRTASGTWDSLGAGFSGSILGAPAILYPHQMHVYGTELIVGGAFKYAGGQLVNGIARWDGARWQAMADGFDGPVYALATYNGELYAGGQFSKSGTTTLENLAKWNGVSWVDPGLGLRYTNTSQRAFVHSLLPTGNRLIVAGGFDRAVHGGRTYRSQSILSFDGAGVDTLHGGIPNTEIEAVTIYKDRLYAGGGANSTSSYIGSYLLPALQVPETPVEALRIVPGRSAGAFEIRAAHVIDKVVVSDLTGRIVCVATPKAVHCSVTVPAPGMFLIAVQAGKDRQVRKILIY